MEVILLGQIPEAIFFALFLVFSKQLKEKRILFTVIMILEYLLLTQLFAFNVWFQIIYTAMSYMTLKVLYKEKAQVTDIFTFSIASLSLIIISIPTFLISGLFTNNMIIANAFQKIILFIVLFLNKAKLPKIQSLYKRFWNRNDKIKKSMKSTTFRAINVVVFNIMFTVINICMLLALYIKEV